MAESFCELWFLNAILVDYFALSLHSFCTWCEQKVSGLGDYNTLRLIVVTVWDCLFRG
jgi:hypothetical protein